VGGSHHHQSYFDPYSRIDGPVHRLPAGVKLFFAVALVVATVSVPVNRWTGITFFPLVGLFLVAVAGLSLVPPGFLLKRVALMEPVVLGVALLALLQPGGGKVFGTLVLRSTICLSTMVLLASTTPFSDLLAVLRRLRVPAILLTTLALMYRYLFVLVEESQRMRRARASRTFTNERRRAWKTLGLVLGQLFVRTGERADRIYAAMCARGWK
jgi:cobalt/nickel transport system permease protein